MGNKQMNTTARECKAIMYVRHPAEANLQPPSLVRLKIKLKHSNS